MKKAKHPVFGPEDAFFNMMMFIVIHQRSHLSITPNPSTHLKYHKHARRDFKVPPWKCVILITLQPLYVKLYTTKKMHEYSMAYI